MRPYAKANTDDRTNPCVAATPNTDIDSGHPFADANGGSSLADTDGDRPSPTPTPLPTELNPPAIQLLAPGPNQQVVVNQPVKISAIAADDMGIIRVDLWADNALYASQSPPHAKLLDHRA